jgi:hypothetical protein
MYESRVVKMVKKFPRSHLIVLQCVLEQVEDSDRGFLCELNSALVVKLYNERADRLCIERVN